MKKLYIFKVGETFYNTKKGLGDFDDWIKNFIEPANITIETIDILNHQALPHFEDALGVIITGSHSMVTDELSWSIQTEQWIQTASKKEIPILGICYGHQLLAKALGGVVCDNPKGKEIGTVQVQTKEEIKEDELFRYLPSNFCANVTHLQTVMQLPQEAVALGFNEHDQHQMVRFSPLIWGVQFHPEFDAPIMKSYIIEQEEELSALGFDIEMLLEEVVDTSASNALLEAFVQISLKSEVAA